jgi:hypothetical protein
LLSAGVIVQPPFDLAGFLLNLPGEFLHIALGFCKDRCRSF